MKQRPRRRAVRKPWEGTGINSSGGSRAWGHLRDRVVQEEPVCRLRLPGCDVRSETADHIIPKCYRPDLSMRRRNLRGSCEWCNAQRGNKPLEQRRAEMLRTNDWHAAKVRHNVRRGIATATVRAAALRFFDNDEGEQQHA